MKTPRQKQLWSVDYASIGADQLERQLIATFTLDGEHVISQWHVPESSLRTHIERNGICVAAGCFTPEDGRPFFDNLALSFSQSATLYVVDVADERTP